MTLDELILYYDGIGYRKCLPYFYRGKDLTGYIDVKYYYKEYLKGNKHTISGGLFAITNEDIKATDWIGKPTKNKLLNLINNSNNI